MLAWRPSTATKFTALIFPRASNGGRLISLSTQPVLLGSCQPNRKIPQPRSCCSHFSKCPSPGSRLAPVLLRARSPDWADAIKEGAASGIPGRLSYTAGAWAPFHGALRTCRHLFAPLSAVPRVILLPRPPRRSRFTAESIAPCARLCPHTNSGRGCPPPALSSSRL
ncbi:uncharacterized protein A4U43_C10F15220 [Asparagus officinalis]|uniref:Uncharacterized protein n=1 Tax=Asparagus officinalis TaxID=4686 RepID=A0A5P1E2W4_ASPOF|nr:uncharacterized protein A4U43_C10F15220 [Asparagus officinalis]